MKPCDFCEGHEDRPCHAWLEVNAFDMWEALKHIAEKCSLASDPCAWPIAWKAIQDNQVPPSATERKGSPGAGVQMGFDSTSGPVGGGSDDECSVSRKHGGKRAHGSSSAPKDCAHGQPADDCEKCKAEYEAVHD